MHYRHLLLSLSILLCVLAGAQTTHDIEAGGGPSGPAPYYEPQFITIELGDIVRWTNSGGTHNVDGSLDAYPDNPEGFTNGSPSSSLWVFEHTFTIAGVYGFECSAFDHADTQFGTITVVDNSVGIEEAELSSFEFYPNPAVDMVTVQSLSAISSIRIMDLEMKVVQLVEVSGNELKEQFNVDALRPATYIIEVESSGKKTVKTFVKK